MNTSKILCRSPLDANTEGLCCVCGGRLPCVDRSTVLSKSTGSLSVLAPIQSELMCVWCASLWKEPKVFSRAILATPEKVEFPTIAPDPESIRPIWKQALQQLDRTLPRVCILTTDPKKRVWCFAQISQGDRLSMYLHDPSRGISGNRTLSIAKWLECLELIERIYSEGISKDAIAQSIYSAKCTHTLDFTQVMQWEKSLAEWRSQPEFIPSLIIAQKQEIKADDSITKSNSIQDDSTLSSSTRGRGHESGGGIQLSLI